MDAEQVAAFRERYRREEIPAGYRPRAHLAFTFGVGGLGLLACLWQVEAVRALELLVVPLAFLYANLAEYLGHRYPMHRPFRGLRLIYQRHAGQHHRFFTHQHMPFDSLRDLRAVLFPPLLVVFFFGGFALPVWWLLSLAVSANVAWLFIATGIGYYLNYEFLHLAYHLPPAHPLARLPLVRRLHWLHQQHHDPRRMATHNFNISYPLCDWLFGTLTRPGTAAGPAAPERA
jgi:hypothetical protein